jgi:hypothetical protein
VQNHSAQPANHRVVLASAVNDWAGMPQFGGGNQS